MYSIVTYSYLVLPLAFLLLKIRFKERIPLIIAAHGIVFFVALLVYDYIPGEFQKYFQVIYTFVEYLIFTYVFAFNTRNKSFRLFIITATLLFGLFQIFFVTTTSFKRLDSIPVGIETILLFVYIFYFFYEFSKQIKDTFIYNHYTFWIAVGVLIYLGGSFFFFILVNELDKSQRDNFGNLTYIAEIIKNILFASSIFIYKKFPSNKIQNHSKNIPNLDMI